MCTLLVKIFSPIFDEGVAGVVLVYDSSVTCLFELMQWHITRVAMRLAFFEVKCLAVSLVMVD